MRSRYTYNTVTIVTLRHRIAQVDRVYPADVGVPLDPVNLARCTPERWRYSFTAKNTMLNCVGSGWVFDRIVRYLATPVEVVEPTPQPPEGEPVPRPWWSQAMATATGRTVTARPPTPWVTAANDNAARQQQQQFDATLVGPAAQVDAIGMARQEFIAARQQLETIAHQREEARRDNERWAELLASPIPLHVNTTPIVRPFNLDDLLTEAPPADFGGDGEDA